MPKLSTAIIDSNLRHDVFNDLGIADIDNFKLVNARCYGTILTDDNGEERYCRVLVQVAELREDMTARELMQSEIDKYETANAKKEATARKRAEKAIADAAKREAKRKEKGKEGE